MDVYDSINQKGWIGSSTKAWPDDCRGSIAQACPSGNRRTATPENGVKTDNSRASRRYTAHDPSHGGSAFAYLQTGVLPIDGGL